MRRCTSSGVSAPAELYKAVAGCRPAPTPPPARASPWHHKQPARLLGHHVHSIFADGAPRAAHADRGACHACHAEQFELQPRHVAHSPQFDLSTRRRCDGAGANPADLLAASISQHHWPLQAAGQNVVAWTPDRAVAKPTLAQKRNQRSGSDATQAGDALKIPRARRRLCPVVCVTTCGVACGCVSCTSSCV